METSETKKVEEIEGVSLADILRNLDQYKALFIICATAYGFFYLFVYATNRGVPLPITESSYPMIVISLASSVLIIFAMLAVMLLAPALVTGNHFQSFFDQTKSWYQNFIDFTLLAGWSVLFLFGTRYFNERIAWILFAACETVCLIFYLFRMAVLPKKKRIYFFGVLFLIQSFFAFLTTIILWGYSLYLSGIKMSDGWYQIAHWVFALPTMAYFFISSFPKQTLFKNFTKEKVVLVMIILAFCIPINLPLFERSLRVFKIGGGYEAVYYIDEELKKCLPMEVLDEKDQGKTKPLKVLMSSGDKKYVKLKEGQQTERIYGLSLGDANEEIIFGVK